MSDRRNNKNRNANTTMLMDARGAEALRALYAMRAPARRPTQPMAALLQDVKKLADEGVDHINVSSRTQTDVGRIFSLEDNMPYTDSVLECKIESLRVFNFFVKTGMQDARLLIPHALPYGTKFKNVSVDGAFLLQAHALWEKLKNYKELQDLLVSLNVPLNWYIFNEGGERIRTVTGTAYAAALVVIQKALCDGEAPDFTMFCPLEKQADLQAMERSERLLEIQRLIVELLHPVRESLKTARVEHEAARAAARAKRNEQRASTNDKGSKFAKGPKPQRKQGRGQKPPVMPSLNHLIPSFAPEEAQVQKPVPVVNSAAVPLELGTAAGGMVGASGALGYAVTPVQPSYGGGACSSNLGMVSLGAVTAGTLTNGAGAGVNLQAAAPSVELGDNAFAELITQVAEKAGRDVESSPSAS